MYKIEFYEEGYEEYADEEFETREEALELIAQLESNNKAGAEVLNASNPGDYPYDEDGDFEIDCEIVEI